MATVIATTTQGVPLGIAISWSRDITDVPIGVHLAIMEICLGKELKVQSSETATSYSPSWFASMDDVRGVAVRITHSSKPPISLQEPTMPLDGMIRTQVVSVPFATDTFTPIPINSASGLIRLMGEVVVDIWTVVYLSLKLGLLKISSRLRNVSTRLYDSMSNK